MEIYRDIQIRPERQEDYQQVRELVQDAFALAEHSDGDEHDLIERMTFPGIYSGAITCRSIRRHYSRSYNVQ